MNDGIYTENELFETENTISIQDAYNIIKNIDYDTDYEEQLDKITYLKYVYEIDPNSKSHIGWLISPYHYISCYDSEQLYFTCGLHFYRDDKNDIILDKDSRYLSKIFNTTFNVTIHDARSHDMVEYRAEHWLHKKGLDGFPLHVSMTCDCGLSHCPYDNEEFYYDERKSFTLQELKDDIPLIKVNLMVYIRENL